MRLYKFTVLIVLLFCLAGTSPASAEVDWQIQKTLNLQSAPIDMTVSAGGSYLLVLTEDGTVHVYSSSGALKGRIQAGKDISSIAAGPTDDIFYVKNTKAKTVQRIAIDFIYDFNLKDSPFKGNPDAPVSIVVFSDYQ